MTQAVIWLRLEIWIRWAAVLPIRLYQWTLSPLLPRACRFAPSCSEYAAEAILTHGPLRGVRLALRRLGRCHPWGGHGYDPVPPVKAAAFTGAPLAQADADAISSVPIPRFGAPNFDGTGTQAVKTSGLLIPEIRDEFLGQATGSPLARPGIR